MKQRPVSVFVGPSLPPVLRPERANIRYLPPAAAGDMLALAQAPPHSVVLIDGLFESERSPWHKEILVLMSEGFGVSGAASLGALRAAELAPCGMVASGTIARAYVDGRITGDDEVAVAHAPAALDYRALSLAQVDVRATLVAAVRCGVLCGDEARALRSASRTIFFKDRSWPLVAAAAALLMSAARHAAFSAWLQTGAVAQKEIDAHAAILAAVARPPGVRIPPPPETSFLSRLRAEISRAPGADTARTTASLRSGETAGTA